MKPIALTDPQVVRLQVVAFARNVTAAIKTLIESKHLYQSVHVTPTDSYHVVKDDKTRVTEKWPSVTEAINAGWPQVDHPGANAVILTAPPDVKVFCTRCKRIEPYNLVHVVDILSRIRNGTETDDGVTQEAYLLAYQCQGCKRTPELFLIRRRGLKLTNEGRSPIEHVDTPSFLPDAVLHFLSGAVVAHQSGQTLAGLFLLRTFVEQWARLSTGSKKEHADQVMDDYMASLPEDFRNRFPSMRQLYGDLSADIHGAVGSSDLFDKAHAQILQHFDARRMFNLPKQ